jgi:protein O-GlcNAc transferase
MGLSPDQPEVLMELGCLLERVGEIPDAMRSFERYIEMKPQDAAGYHNLSLCYYSTGLIDQGIELSLKVLSLQSDHIPALQNLAFAYMIKKQFTPMREYLRMALQIAPNDLSLKALRRQAALAVWIDRLSHPWRAFRR